MSTQRKKFVGAPDYQKDLKRTLNREQLPVGVKPVESFDTALSKEKVEKTPQQPE